MKIKILMLVAILAFLTSCQTMHFKKAPSSPTDNLGPLAANFDNWHHIGVLSLIEFSDPLTLENQGCRDWDSVTVQLGFLNGLVSGYTGIYNPWEARMKCK